ncbi:permease [Acinetobacter sp. ANC 5380]|uniref:Permease n=1 Tax=Acinetobacter terrae TaxID=2731247 RepID=A0A7Y2RIP9_9GAMM|nr:permease [Acinetobacter terrae]
MALFLPLFGFLCGWGLASTQFSAALKPLFASLLARFFIPVVIIYTMVFYQAGSLSLMIFSFVVAIFMFYAFHFIFKDKLRALCVSYVNLAWLGFPFALALFGPEISAAMVALYVGGSIFGNIWAVTAVSLEAQPFSTMIKKVALSPPVFALLIALICRIAGLQHLQQHDWLDIIYSFAKVGMSFTGMCVLGMWLRHTKVHVEDLLRSGKIFLIKIIVGVVICSLTYFFIPIPNIENYIGVMFLLFCLPPAANIVALETHYQGTGTSAKYIASGTIMSCVVVMLYGVILHLLLPSL